VDEIKIKITCILLVWGIFVGSTIIELISGFFSLGFDEKDLLPQGLTRSPNYFGLLNNLMTLIICESLREIGEIVCVTPAWSSCGQTLKYLLKKHSFPATPNVKNKCWTLHESLESTGKMKLMMKFYLCLHNFSELRKLYLSFPREIVFSVISGSYLYL